MTKDRVSFGKGQNVDFTNRGISQESFKTDDPKKRKLTESIFKKYDENQDGVLDVDELNAMKKDLKSVAGLNKKIGDHEANRFLHKNLGLDKDYNRKDLLEILQFIDADTDDIANAKTKDNVTVISYKPDTKGTRKEETYNNNGPKPRLEKVVTTEKYNSKITTTKYDERGQISDLVIQKGNITEFYDPKTGKIMRSKEGSGKAFLEYKEYEYNLDDGNGNKFDRVSTVSYSGIKTVSDKKADGTVFESKYNKDGNLILETEFNSKGKKSIETKYNQDGTWVKLDFRNGRTNKTTGTINNQSVNSAENKPVIDESAEKPEKLPKSGTQNLEQNIKTQQNQSVNNDIQYSVDKNNDTWYGIVQAKYGISDHKTTMEIVHQLKSKAGVSRKDKEIPDTIALPSKVTVNNKEYSLQDINASVNPIHFKKL